MTLPARTTHPLRRARSQYRAAPHGSPERSSSWAGDLDLRFSSPADNSNNAHVTKAFIGDAPCGVKHGAIAHRSPVGHKRLFRRARITLSNVKLAAKSEILFAMSSRATSLLALRAFDAAARHLSFTYAARELHVSQAAISRHVRALEEDLGRPLFRRHT
jgi:hypothetical protein